MKVKSAKLKQFIEKEVNKILLEKQINPGPKVISLLKKYNYTDDVALIDENAKRYQFTNIRLFGEYIFGTP